MNQLKSTREGYGDALVELGEENPNIVALCADLTKSTETEKFAEKFPQRFFQVGVAEQNMAGIAAGLALNGKVVFMASYACFSPGRNYDFIRTQICYNFANVKIIGSHAGLSASKDGATHQMLEDVGIMRMLPNMVVFSPCDYLEAKRATILASQIQGPVYIRLFREKGPNLTTKDQELNIGKWTKLKEGNDLCLIASGPILEQVLLAADYLQQKSNLNACVINATSIKPLDDNALLELSEKFGLLFVIEEHQIYGGLGSAVCEFLSQNKPTKVFVLGVKETFGESASYHDLLTKHKLDGLSIYERVIKYLHEHGFGTKLRAKNN